MSLCSKIELGTAQFGLRYGIANGGGRPGVSSVEAIIRQARLSGVNSLDTAIAYGNSEAILGSVGIRDFNVITKLPGVGSYDSDNVRSWVDTSVAGSLMRLGVAQIYGVLLHRPSDLLGPSGAELNGALQDQVSAGRVAHIGVSIYDPAELDLLVSKFNFDIVQAPLSVLDGRLQKSGWVERLQDLGISLHVRSIFLQGLLLMPRSQRPEYFRRWDSVWDRWDAWLREHNLSPIQAAVRFALHMPGVEKVVLGVDSPAQLGQIVAVADEGPLPVDYQSLSTTDAELLNPSLWKLN